MSSGHDEYWSGNEVANVKAALAAGVNLAFFSGNEIFWKTRWGPSQDGSNTPYRTLTTYKETHFNAPTDPQDPPTWTGAWADPALQSSGRRRITQPTRSRASSSSSTRGRRTSLCPRSTASCVSGGTRRSPGWRRAERDAREGQRNARLRMGRRRRTTASGRPARSTSPRPPSRACSRSSTTGAPRGPEPRPTT